MVQIWDQLIIKDDLLWRLLENNDGTGYIIQLVVPNSLKTAVLRDVHEGILGGHLGVDKSLGKLKKRYVTRWLEAWPIPNQETKTVAEKLLNEMFFHFSLPHQILSDQGQQFESALIAELCSVLQIEKSRTTPYHLQGDELVERSNCTLLSMLSTVVDGHPQTWESYLRAVSMAYNTSIQPTTGYSPFFLMFGRKARLPIDIVYDNLPVDSFVNISVALENAYQHVRNTMGLKQDRQKDCMIVNGMENFIRQEI